MEKSSLLEKISALEDQL